MNIDNMKQETDIDAVCEFIGKCTERELYFVRKAIEHRRDMRRRERIEKNS